MNCAIDWLAVERNEWNWFTSGGDELFLLALESE